MLRDFSTSHSGKHLEARRPGLTSFRKTTSGRTAEIDIILEYWGHFPTSKGAWQSVLTKLWQYNFALVLQTYTETKWESMHHFLVSLKTCLGSWRKCSHGLPPPTPCDSMCCHPCCSYLIGRLPCSNVSKTHCSPLQPRAGN